MYYMCTHVLQMLPVQKGVEMLRGVSIISCITPRGTHIFIYLLRVPVHCSTCSLKFETVRDDPVTVVTCIICTCTRHNNIFIVIINLRNLRRRIRRPMYPRPCPRNLHFHSQIQAIHLHLLQFEMP